MDIKADFLNALVSNQKYLSDYRPEDFLGQIYDTDTGFDSFLFGILAGGNMTAVSPWSFDIRFLNCFMLLYTKKGCGKLLLENQVYTLTESTLLFLDCRQRFRLDIAIGPWEYQVLFIAGKGLSDYYSLIPSLQAAIMPLTPYSESALNLEKLLIAGKNDSLSSKLRISSLLNTIITGCIIYQLSEKDFSSPATAYLNEIKELFDDHFQEDFSLDNLEQRFNVSKYKLCREFGATFGMPPLQYLNRRRIEYAKHLLLTTSLKVHEVGSQVGIDNTNHFISLFKKFTGFTPLEFKQKGHEF